MLGLLLVGTAVAGIGMKAIDKDLEMSREYRDALVSINLSSYDYEDTERDGLYQRCLYKKDSIDACSDFTNISEKSLDEWEEEIMKEVANATIVRQAEPEETKTKEGKTTIKEKKDK